MAGRHLTQQYFLLLCLCAFLLGGTDNPVNETMHSNDREVFCLTNFLFIDVILVGGIWNYCTPRMESAWPITNDVIDERHFYLSKGGEIPLFKSLWHSMRGDGYIVKSRNAFRERRICSAYEKGERGLCFGSEIDDVRNSWNGVPVLFGKDIFAALDLDMYLTDVIALQDPLMARLKVLSTGNWRVGHVIREIPRGYNETLASGENRIEDPSLHEYYDKLLLVMKGPLFNRDRLCTIFELNCGKYDKLLERYERRQ